MPQIEFRPVNRVRPDCAWLLDHRANVTSQIGQDGILAKIFEVIGPGARYCVEFGAWDGRWLPNTYSLIADRGWRGLLIGNPMQMQFPMHLSRRCGARTRSASPCRSPAMPNGRCRMHGGKSPVAPRAKANGNYRHGRFTSDAIERRRSLNALIR